MQTHHFSRFSSRAIITLELLGKFANLQLKKINDFEN